MCRSHRRCPSSSNRARTRALNTANKRVERARNALRTARAAGDPDGIAAAEQRLTAAQTDRERVAAAHPLPQDRGHDITGDNNTDRPAPARHGEDQRPDTTTPDASATADPVAAAEDRVRRAHELYQAARAAGDSEAARAAEQEAVAAQIAKMDAQSHARRSAAQVHATTRVEGRDNITITGHTGPLDRRDWQADSNGNITINGPGARPAPTGQQPTSQPQADHAETLRAHMENVHERVADAQRRARQAATASGAGDHTVVTGDNQVTVHGVTGDVSVTADPDNIHIGRVTGQVRVNGKRVR
ncbi:hypothetical protein [Actinokineospora fastidiosa]|uniref:Uncharacterized protein n=1 Tax=Actinokineospora fastidiosa TaxID=1816 RepID=A0A918LKF5_9PSEU|nr:hypothetical protein [Actinokineospora fastidiosa]GGS61411.1 hypothetical protein GCM10010171_65280 [Actinokineospora fastidiosa]